MAWKWGAASVQWYTPPHLLERWAAEYGPFDLDPCADPRSPVWPLIPAHWTLADDGLVQAWTGRVFCNPPYGRSIQTWVDKAADEIAASRATVVVMLVPAKTDTAWWWRALERGAEPVFLKGRVRFVLPSGEVKQGAGFPSALLVFRMSR